MIKIGVLGAGGRMGQAIIAETFLSFEIWFVVAAIYLIFTISLSSLARLLERNAPSPHLEDSCTE